MADVFVTRLAGMAMLGVRLILPMVVALMLAAMTQQRHWQHYKSNSTRRKQKTRAYQPNQRSQQACQGSREAGSRGSAKESRSRR